MARLRKTFLTAAAVVVAALAFATWYRFQYSMEAARSFEVNDPASQQRVLIATQGSAFKDAVMSGVVAHLKARPAYVKVIDVSELPEVKEDDWSAIVLLHTWEMSKPQADAKAFVERARDTGKIVVLSTSGAGDQKMQGVDAISSASVMADAADRVTKITARVDAILGAGR